MNLILLNNSDIIINNDNYYAKLTDSKFKHCVDVLKVKIGDIIRVGVINYGAGTAHVENISDSSVTIKLDSPLHLMDPNHITPVVDIAFVVPRPKAFDRCIKTAVMLGVGKIMIVCTDNIERAYLSSHNMTTLNIINCIISGLEQSMDTIFPPVDLLRSWSEFLEHLLVQYYSLFIVLDQTGTEDMSRIINHRTGPILLIVGPERGWRDFELQKFKSLDFMILSLGSRVLTTNTAIAVSLGLVNTFLYNKTIRNTDPCVRNAPVYGNLINYDQS